MREEKGVFGLLLRMEKKDEVGKDIQKVVGEVSFKLKELEEHERMEWAKVLLCKCRQLLHERKLKPLKDTLRILVFNCRPYRIAIDEAQIEAIAKEAYFIEYGKIILPIFVQCGLDTEQYQVLTYPQNLLGKFFKYVSDLF